jgi:hypothetical protein
MSGMALGSTLPPVKWVQAALSLGIKHQGCEALPLLPNMPSWHGTQFKKNLFTFTHNQFITITVFAT